MILASRIGFIIFLVLTFAQPYIPNKDANKESADKAIALYIDNSFSTQAESANGIVLEYEKIKANQIIEAYPANTQFYLFTNALNSTELLPKTKEEIQAEEEQRKAKIAKTAEKNEGKDKSSNQGKGCTIS